MGQQLIRSLTWQGAHVVAHLGIPAPRTKSDEQGQFTDAETITALEGIALEVVDMVGTTGEQRLRWWSGLRVLLELRAGTWLRCRRAEPGLMA